MTEYRLSSEPVPYVSTFAYHEHRERAPHLEQQFHQERLHRAASFVHAAVAELGGRTSLSDLGCGDGGLLSLVQDIPGLVAWGYDFQPSNSAGWAERGVTAEQVNVFNGDRDEVRTGDIVVMTEVLEHLADPHEALRWVRGRSRRLICSSPWNESPAGYSDCHAWAWDMAGYAGMISAAGWTVTRHEQAGLFQVVLAE